MHWLQDYLCEYEGVLIVISHDRHFLNSVCTHTADIDYQTVIMYTGGYDDMVLAKTQIRSRIEAENAAARKENRAVERIHRAVFGRHAFRAGDFAQEGSRAPADLRTGEVQHPRPYIRFDMKQPSGRTRWKFKGVAKSYDGLKVIPTFHGERRARRKNRADGPQRRGQNHAAEIADPQRAGISSRMPTGNFRSMAARSQWGHEVAVGYFAQDHAESITKGTTVIEWLHQFDPQASQEELRGVLGQMLFSGEDALKPTQALSGGESARLIFCRLMLQKPNVLVLDEPTNHLDLESINALNIALQKYDGTVLLVTHDHDVIDEVATRIWHFQGGHIEDFKGPYEEYVAYEEAKAAQNPAATPRTVVRRASVPS